MGLINKIKSFFQKAKEDNKQMEPSNDRGYINYYKGTKLYKSAKDGMRYYAGDQDIKNKTRRTLDANGNATTDSGALINNRIMDNQYRDLVDLKSNYILGNPITVKSKTKNKEYDDLIQPYFNKHFNAMLLWIAQDSFNSAIGYMYVGLDENGEFYIDRMNPLQMFPVWSNDNHTKLDRVYREYSDTDDRGAYTTFVEEYTREGVASSNGFKSYLNVDGQGGSWDKVQIIPFKYNLDEIPLITNIKSLQDALNTILSNFTDNMQEDMRSTILVIKNYDGQDLGEFRANLMKYGAVKVETADGSQGGVEALQVEVNSSNYEAIIKVLKDGIISAGRGVDLSSFSGAVNEMTISSIYAKMDIDANKMITNFKMALDQYLYFVNKHIQMKTKKDWSGEEVDFIFNKDILVNNATKIENITNSVGLVSNRTLLSNHPMVEDVEAELKQIKMEQEESLVDPYTNIDNTKVDDADGDE